MSTVIEPRPRNEELERDNHFIFKVIISMAIAFVLFAFIFILFVSNHKKNEVTPKPETQQLEMRTIQLASDEVDFWKQLIVDSNSRLSNSVLYADRAVLELRKRTVAGNEQ